MRQAPTAHSCGQHMYMASGKATISFLHYFRPFCFSRQTLQSSQRCEIHSTRYLNRIVQVTSPYLVVSHSPLDILSRTTGKMCLLANWALTGEHHGGSTSTKPGIVVGSFSTDDAADGHEKTVDRKTTISCRFRKKIRSV